MSNISFGTVLKDLTLLQPNIESEAIDEIKLKFAVVMSQACDIAQYQRQQDKLNNYLPNILILPLYLFEDFAQRKHIAISNTQEEILSKKQREKYQDRNNGNIDKRYHYIHSQSFISKVEQIELITDFKHYYTISYNLLERQLEDCYFGLLKDLYKEQLSQRFCNYLSRIGLPDAKE